MITVNDTAISGLLCVIFVLSAAIAKSFGLWPLAILLITFAGFAGGFCNCTIIARNRQDKAKKEVGKRKKELRQYPKNFDKNP